MSHPRAIAIVGLAGRFPGAASADALWELISHGRSVAREVPADRWPVEAASIVKPGAGPDTARSYRACVLEPFELDVPGLDGAKLSLLTKVTLDVGFETFRTAKASINRARTAAFIANIALPTDGASAFAEAVMLDGDPSRVDAREAFPAAGPVGLLAKSLGLGGGCFTLDAACASSLYALHLACCELEAGRIDAALAGGVSVPQQLYTQVGFTQLHALSPSGLCAPFTAAADGLVVGEGAGMVLLKRLVDAERDGDQVLGVIRGIGLSNDVGGSLLSPDSEGQLRAMRAAYSMAGWEPSEVELVECHGTGTPRGDRVELESLTTLFGASKPVIGSVKSNVGHLLTAAGMAALTKVLKALANETLPPSANVEGRALSPATAGFELLTHPRPWASKRPRRAAVSGFGFGGINAHVLIEQYQPRTSSVGLTYAPVTPIAIVGVGVHVGSITTTSALGSSIAAGRSTLQPRPASRWRVESKLALEGAWIEALEIPVGRFKLPPLEIPSVLPQQLLMLEVAANAVQDAGGLGAGPHLRAGAIIGLGLDLETTNYHLRWVLERHVRAALQRSAVNATDAEISSWVERARALVSAPLDAPRVLGALGGMVTSRLARELSLGGPCFGVQADEASGLRAVELAVRMLERGEVDLMIVGAVDLAGDLRHVVGARALGRLAAPADGAAALVLQRHADAVRDGRQVAALVSARGVVEAAPQTDLDALLGNAGAASGAVDLAAAAVAFRHRLGVPRRTVRRAGPDDRTIEIALEPGTQSTSAFVGERPAALFLVDEEHRPTLRELVGAHRAVSIDRLAAEWFHRGHHQGRALVATSTAELLRQLDSPGTAPVRLDGELGFVFPGSGSHFEGMGEALSRWMPEVHAGLAREVADFSKHVFPAQAAGPAGLADIIVRQVTHGLVMHDALRLLGVTGQAYLGYSLGESAALFASRTWRERDTMFGRTLSSPLFRSQLTSDGTVLRQAFGADATWLVALVMRSPDEIRAVLSGTAALLIVNAPGECVIGGRSDDVRAVVGRLGGAAVFLEGIPFVHLPAIAPVVDDYRALHLLPTTPVAGVRMYSCAWARAFAPSREACADSIVDNATRGFDFTKLIEQAWADGVRVFVEPGPQGSCTRMIGRILGSRPHLAVSACHKGVDGYVSVLTAAAKISDSGRPIDLAALYAKAPRLERTGATVRVVVGGPPMTLPPLPSSVPHVALVQKPMVDAAGQVSVSVSPVPMGHSSGGPVDVTSITRMARATAEAHEVFLKLARQSFELQLALMRGSAEPVSTPVAPALARPARFGRAACLELATGRLSRVLGEQFAAVDTFPSRVRLPAEPLMLVDRIVEVEGEPGGMGSGRVITEHDVHEGAWYLDGGRVPVCISVEAGQADLFLSAYLGIDLQTKGERVYRLLDAKVTFHRELPRAGEIIRYDIRIDRFVRQGDTWLFFFRFDGTINGTPFITMSDGCAGFFSAEQLSQGRGIVVDARPRAPRVKGFTALAPGGTHRLDERQVDALRAGDLETAFGQQFPIASLAPALRLPGGRMKLVDRILELDTSGGAAGLGMVLGEHDVSPDAWYLTCHFPDDPVMPGTLMYECCLHTLRVLLLRLGWVAPSDVETLHIAPVLGQTSQLKCRGQVLPSTKRVQYRVEIDEIGYAPEPYVIATASMFADGKHVVQMEGMSARIVGLSKASLEALWAKQQPVFTGEQIVEYCEGEPSKCFGPAYRPFDRGGRRLARLPRDPFRFIDRVTACEPKPLVMEPGGWITCEYDVPPDAWYFRATGQPTMPFSVLLEAALQPCGFLAAHVGSALTTEDVLSFRNLDGSATVLREVLPSVGTLQMRARLTKVSRAGGMLLQEFDFEVNDREGLVYSGHTGFGFFPPAALAAQVGLRGGASWALQGGSAHDWPRAAPSRPDDRAVLRPHGLTLPATAYAMNESARVSLEGGQFGLGFVEGTKRVDPTEWFFAAHFFEDPVMPGSLGLEALQQLLLVYARERFPERRATHRSQSMAVGVPHVWQYRGQVVPTNALVTVQAQIKRVEGELIVADGQLVCDGKVIYGMRDFAIRLVEAP